MPPVGAVDPAPPRVLDVHEHAVIIGGTLLALSIPCAPPPDGPPHPPIVRLAKDVPARQGHYLRALLQADRTRDRDAEYLPGVVVAVRPLLIAEDVGLRVVREIAGRTLHGAVLGCRGPGPGRSHREAITRKTRVGGRAKSFSVLCGRI